MLLEQKFDEIKNDGLLYPSALNSATNDIPDTPATMIKPRLVKRTPSATVSARKPQSLDVQVSGI